MKFNEFIFNLTSEKSLDAEQLQNLLKLKEIIFKFHKKSGTLNEGVKDLLDADLEKNVVVLEAAHQPNFIPHVGVWKKAFLLDYIAKRLEEQGFSALPLFGFVDYDLSNNPWLSQNRLPAKTNQGYLKVGFRIPEDSRFKRFNSIKKPSVSDWNDQLNKIKIFYSENCKDEEMKSCVNNNLGHILEELTQSYTLGGTFSEVNAIFFSRVCNNLFGLRTLFFNYSDVQKEKMFIREWSRIIDNIEDFNKIYIDNSSDSDEDVAENYFPFWYHCDCGGKAPLILESKEPIVCSGKCQVCGSGFNLDLTHNLDDFYSRMSVRAVTRNIVFAEALGTSVYVSGSGGGLRYGYIADKISNRLELNNPITLVWQGRDYYLGASQLNLLDKLGRILGVRDVISEKEKFLSRLDSFREELKTDIDVLEGELETVKNEKSKLHQNKLGMGDERLASVDEKHRGIIKGLQRSKDKKRVMDATSKSFDFIPSALDIFTVVGIDGPLVDAWAHSMKNATVLKQDWFFEMRGDVAYDKIPCMHGVSHNNIEGIIDYMRRISENDFAE